LFRSAACFGGSRVILQASINEVFRLIYVDRVYYFLYKFLFWEGVMVAADKRLAKKHAIGIN
jgi:hypothetical protein